MQEEPIWLIEARKYLGIKEFKGQKHEPKIVQFWRSIGLSGVKDDETPWCAAFVGAMLENVGLMSTKSGWARSYLEWGVPLAFPIIGCVVVFSRKGGGGHVGFVIGKDEDGNLLVLGGNQGDSVSIKAFRMPPYPDSRVLGYRWPAAVPMGLYYGHLTVYGSAELSSKEN